MKENKLLNQLDKLDGSKVIKEVSNIGDRIKGFAIFIIALLLAWGLAHICNSDRLVPFLFGYIIILTISRQVMKIFQRRCDNILDGYGDGIYRKLDYLTIIIGAFITIIILCLYNDGKIIRTILMIAVSVVVNILAYYFLGFCDIKEIKLSVHIIVNEIIFSVNTVFIAILIEGVFDTLKIVAVVLGIIYLLGRPDAEIHYSDGRVGKVYKR